jgi:hypothetical protein
MWRVHRAAGGTAAAVSPLARRPAAGVAACACQQRHRHSASTDLGGRRLTLEVGRIGPLADAVVFARFGDTAVLASAVSAWALTGDGGSPPLAARCSASVPPAPVRCCSAVSS